MFVCSTLFSTLKNQIKKPSTSRFLPSCQFSLFCKVTELEMLIVTGRKFFVNMFSPKINIHLVCLPSCRLTRRVYNILPDSHLHRTCTGFRCSDKQPGCLNCNRFHDLFLAIPIKRPAKNKIIMMKVLAYFRRFEFH